MKFASSWRPAQVRVLETVERHLADRKLHVVAPPGSGKTVLGLELFRRLGKPAIAFSPTRTIQWQWIARLREFLDPDTSAPPVWASLDLERPGYFTSVTYQALHTRFRSRPAADSDEDDELVSSAPTQDQMRAVAARFRTLGVGTIILDEAHHLRQQWWKALSFLVEELGEEITTVSLTATPPYDVLGSEWQRYEELCGPIDDEISVPELVKDGTLCPHQDYIWAVLPSETDARTARQHDAAVRTLTDDLLQDEQFLVAVEGHPWIREERPSAEDVLDWPELACALLLYLRARHRVLPRRLLRLLDWTEADLPTLDRHWWHLLIEAYIDEKTWMLNADAEDHRQRLLHRLRRERLLWRRELRVSASRAVRIDLSLTPSKIEGCVRIHKAEATARGSRLRQVVLTDYIDDEALETVSEAPRRVAACPVFIALARHSPDPTSVALLTGRIAAVHTSCVPALRRELGDSFETQGIADLESFVRIEAAPTTRLIESFTRLLQRGDLRVLVGTRSLLGEGWDAPCVNSLVLASFVGSYVLANQMRGRALRIDPTARDKAASIWHLVAVDPSTMSGTGDLLDLQRRFSAFVGLAEKRPTVESGYARLDAPLLSDNESIDLMNREMARRLAACASLEAAWGRAIERAQTARVLPTVATPGPKTRRIVLARTLQYVLAIAAATFMTVWNAAIRSIPQDADLRMVVHFLLIAAIAGAVLALPNLIRYAMLSWRHLPVDGSIRQIAEALLAALSQAGTIGKDCRATSLVIGEVAPGIFHVSLASGTFLEKSLFADCLQEILGPIQNPRYLITRRGVWWRRRKQDYHAVPQTLSQRRERAHQFLESWRRHVGPGDLIFTRTPEGRRVLLQGRAMAFSRAFARRAERLDRWH